MKIVVKCNKCNVTILVADGPLLNDQDAYTYQNSCSCATDGPFEVYDSNGNLLPMDYSNIEATLTND